MVRAKFKVDSIERNEPAGGGTVRLSPIVDGSDENKAFYKWTPGGHIVLSTINESAIAQFVLGTAYYVDFTKAQ